MPPVSGGEDALLYLRLLILPTLRRKLDNSERAEHRATDFRHFQTPVARSAAVVDQGGARSVPRIAREAERATEQRQGCVVPPPFKAQGEMCVSQQEQRNPHRRLLRAGRLHRTVSVALVHEMRRARYGSRPGGGRGGSTLKRVQLPKLSQSTAK
jgi:hypothetical protein